MKLELDGDDIFLSALNSYDHSPGSDDCKARIPQKKQCIIFKGLLGGYNEEYKHLKTKNLLPIKIS